MSDSKILSKDLKTGSLQKRKAAINALLEGWESGELDDREALSVLHEPIRERLEEQPDAGSDDKKYEAVLPYLLMATEEIEQNAAIVKRILGDLSKKNSGKAPEANEGEAPSPTRRFRHSNNTMFGILALFNCLEVALILGILVGMFVPEFVLFGRAQSRWWVLLCYGLSAGSALFLDFRIIRPRAKGRIVAKANALWEDNRKEDAAEIYTRLITGPMYSIATPGSPVILQRAIEYYLGAGENLFALELFDIGMRAAITVPSDLRDQLEQIANQQEQIKKQIRREISQGRLCAFCLKRETSKDCGMKLWIAKQIEPGEKEVYIVKTKFELLPVPEIPRCATCKRIYDESDKTSYGLEEINLSDENILRKRDIKSTIAANRAMRKIKALKEQPDPERYRFPHGRTYQLVRKRYDTGITLKVCEAE